MENRVINLVKKVFKLNDNQISINTKESDINNWDSLGHLNLILELEKEFNIKINVIDALKLDNIKDIVTYLENK